MKPLLILIASLAAGLLFSAAEQVQRPLARLLRMMLLSFAALLGLTGLAVGVTGLASETWWAAIIGGGLVAAGLRLAWKLRRRKPRAEMPHLVPLTATAPDPHWRQLESQLDWVARQQARKARSAIDRFVAERDSPSLSVEHRTLLISCEKRVPELIGICLDRCRNAQGPERQSYIDSTLETLVQIGAEAARARGEVREADDRRLQVLHRYFDGVASPADGVGTPSDRRP